MTSAYQSTLFSQHHINQAWQWLIKQRQHFPANSDIWHLRFHQAMLLPAILKQLNAGAYQFSPPQLITKQNGEQCVVWSSADAFVHKLLALHLAKILPVHAACAHVKHHGGHKGSVNQVSQWLASNDYHYVCRTDIKGYYANINHNGLYDQLCQYINCRIIRNLLYQTIHYSVEYGGTFHTPYKGISRGCALSPLLAGFQLYVIDAYFSSQPQLKYSRFMDDFIILAKTRWQLRKAVKKLNQFFNHFGFIQHPDKTFIGRTKKQFDWLGYQFNQTHCVGPAKRCWANHVQKLRRLYEQTRFQGWSSQLTQQRVAQYQKRWLRWFGLPSNLWQPIVDLPVTTKPPSLG